LLSEFGYGAVEVAEGGTTHHAPPSSRRSLLGLSVVETEISDCCSGACELGDFDPVGTSDGLPGLTNDSLDFEHVHCRAVEELDQVVAVKPSLTA
jgi:hypothetical protein